MMRLTYALLGGLIVGSGLAVLPARADEPAEFRTYHARPAYRHHAIYRPRRRIVREVVVRPVYRTRRVVREVIVERPIYYRPRPVVEEVIIERDGPPPYAYGPPPFRPRFAYGPPFRPVGFGFGYGPRFGYGPYF